MTHTDDDDAFDAALAQHLGPEADDTAPLSRAVLTRMAATAPPRRAPLADVLALPGPAAGLLLGALGLAATLGYALLPGDAAEIIVLQTLFGSGG